MRLARALVGLGSTMAIEVFGAGLLAAGAMFGQPLGDLLLQRRAGVELWLWRCFLLWKVQPLDLKFSGPHSVQVPTPVWR